MSRIKLLILFVLTSMMMAAQTPASINVTQKTPADPINVTQKTPADPVGKYRLYVKDIPELQGKFIYGQFRNEDSTKFYGGKNVEYFNKAYEKANNEAKSKGVEINRDENGVYFSIPEKPDLDSLTVYIVGAINIPKEDGSPDWNPDHENYVPVRWILHSANVISAIEIQYDGSNEKTEAEETEAEEQEPETSDKGDSWSVSRIDWILFALVIVALVVALLSKGPKKQNKEYDTERALRDIQRYVSSLQTDIENLKTINISNKATFAKLEEEILILKKNINILTAKKSERPEQERGFKVSTSKPTVAAGPRIVGYAIPEDDKLVLADVNNGFFEITHNTDGKLTFTLVQNDEVLNFFSTNAGMLQAYRQKGIISYDEIPQNSHVRVSAPGVLTQDTSSSFRVVAPLKLSFA